MLDALAFLPEADVQTGMDFIRQSVPSGQHKDQLTELVSYFDSAYVSGGLLVYPLVAVDMFLVSATKLLPVCCPSVAGYKGIQVDRDINE